MLVSKAKALPDVLKSLEDDDDEYENEERAVVEDRFMERHNTMARETNTALLDDVNAALRLDDEEAAESRIRQEEAERRRKEAERQLEISRQGVLSIEGKMDKRSPATNLWQGRYFKLLTQQIDDVYNYKFLWYKKQGGSVLNEVDARSISGLALMQSSRALSYLSEEKRACLALEASSKPHVNISEQGGPDFDAQQQTVGASKLIGLATGSGGTTTTYFSFCVRARVQDADDDHPAGAHASKDKDIVLRVKSVDKMIQWLNYLAQVSMCVYYVCICIHLFYFLFVHVFPGGPCRRLS